jgi:hypothetical protein
VLTKILLTFLAMLFPQPVDADLVTRATKLALDRKGCLNQDGGGCEALRERVDEYMPEILRGCLSVEGVPDELCLALAVNTAGECTFGKCLDGPRYNPGERSFGWFQLAEEGRHWQACEEHFGVDGHTLVRDPYLSAKCTAWRVKYLFEERLPKACSPGDYPQEHAWGVALSAFGVGTFQGCRGRAVKARVCPKVDGVRVCSWEVVRYGRPARISAYWGAAVLEHPVWR